MVMNTLKPWYFFKGILYLIDIGIQSEITLIPNSAGKFKTESPLIEWQNQKAQKLQTNNTTVIFLT